MLPSSRIRAERAADPRGSRVFRLAPWPLSWPRSDRRSRPSANPCFRGDPPSPSVAGSSAGQVSDERRSALRLGRSAIATELVPEGSPRPPADQRTSGNIPVATRPSPIHGRARRCARSTRPIPRPDSWIVAQQTLAIEPGPPAELLVLHKCRSNVCRRVHSYFSPDPRSLDVPGCTSAIGRAEGKCRGLGGLSVLVPQGAP